MWPRVEMLDPTFGISRPGPTSNKILREKLAIGTDRHCQRVDATELLARWDSRPSRHTNLHVLGLWLVPAKPASPPSLVVVQVRCRYQCSSTVDSDLGSSSMMGKTASQERVVLFTTTERLQQILNMLAAGSCVVMLASSRSVDALRWWFFSILCYSLTNMAVRHALGYMQDQHRACQFCGWWVVLLANLMWMSYYSIAVEVPKLLNENAFLLVLQCLFLTCIGCAGALASSWAQRICMSVLSVAHNYYANSLVPVEIKLFSDVEAGIMVGFMAMIAHSLVRAFVSLVPQLVTYITRTDDAEASVRRAQKVVAELSQHVAALESARRIALANGGTQLHRRRATPARPAEPNMLGGPLGSVREE